MLEPFDRRHTNYRLEKAEPLPTTVGPARATSELLPDSALKIADVMDKIKALLIEKNLAYGDSATDPIRLFSGATAEEQILVRIDDKLSRIARGHEFQGEDTLTDLVGYLVLLLVVRDEPAQ